MYKNQGLKPINYMLPDLVSGSFNTTHKRIWANYYSQTGKGTPPQRMALFVGPSPNPQTPDPTPRRHGRGVPALHRQGAPPRAANEPLGWRKGRPTLGPVTPKDLQKGLGILGLNAGLAESAVGFCVHQIWAKNI